MNLKLKLGTSDYKCMLDYALLQYAGDNYRNKSSLCLNEFKSLC